MQCVSSKSATFWRFSRCNQCKAAEELGMHRNTLSRTLTELGLDSAQIRQGMRRPPNSVRPDRSARPGLQIVGAR